MQYVIQYIENYWFELSAGLVAVVLFLYIYMVSRRLRAYKKLTALAKGGNIEEHILHLEKCLAQQGRALADLRSQLRVLEGIVRAYPGRWHLLRYNAFENTGSDLSFTLALLNDNADGIVLTSIFGREDSRLYAKPIIGGKSQYTLAEEEEQAIKAAMAKTCR
ncbi:MAG: DUF4446 family protein [Firmicutes bacterium]|jgi:hypothetical protein|nr:DUF4446 family protein [Bacillota bacterium]HOB34775.1 DUF4446 family protein [Bacillota bacterium]HPZ91023.1 DUF4446 family protein [Bacillota bacterium]HQE02052.1 DUF4446 family protein [Bacillota bacterium]